jgi:cytochrome c551
MQLTDVSKIFALTTVLALGACDDDEDDGGGSGTDGGDRTAAILGLDGNASAGQSVFANNLCSNAICHGTDGTNGDAPSLAEQVAAGSDQQLVTSLLNGKGDMPTQGALSDQELADVLAWLNETFG